MKEYILAPGRIPENMKLYGVADDLTRMPLDVAETVSKSVHRMAANSTGGRLRFRTDSVLIRCDVYFKGEGCLNSGIDVICDGSFRGKMSAPGENDSYYWGEFTLANNSAKDGKVAKKMRDVTVFLPRTAVVDHIVIKLDDGASVEMPKPYRIEKPIVFYGSSITMGGSSASPSLTYTARVAERLGADHINLGFGGSALAEENMAKYIATLDMTAFVYDYEHNAGTIDYLRKTHKPFFDIVRAAKPDLPILMISRPDTDREFLRSCMGRRVIMDTFHAALDAGDTHVDFVDGFYLWGNESRDLCTVDGCHPNEMGFCRMADVVAPRLRALIERDGPLGMGEDYADDVWPESI